MDSKITLREILARRLERLGGPASTEDVLQLHDAVAGEVDMPVDERERRLSRLSADPEAARRLRELMRFPEPTASDDEDTDPAAIDRRWQALRHQLADSKMLPASTGTVAPVPIPTSWPLVERWLPLAASFVMGVALVLLYGTLGMGSDEASIRANPYAVQLIESDGPERTQGVESVGPESASISLLLMPQSPIVAGDGPFKLRVLDTDSGGTLFTVDSLVAGRGGVLRLDVPRTHWRSGAFELVLERDGAEVATFFLEIELQP